MENDSMAKKNEGDSYGPRQPSMASSVDRDEMEMALMGKKQQFRRNFSFLPILGLSCLITNTWEGVLILFVYGLENGGSGGMIIGYFYSVLGFLLILSSLGELMSMWPTSGGQYHWTYTLAPRRSTAFVSYFVGWQSVIMWQACFISASYLTATELQGLVLLNYQHYKYERWQGTLIIYCIVLVAGFVNTFLGKVLPTIENLMLMLHLCGFVVIIACITAMCPEYHSSHEVFSDFSNNGGWPTYGVSWFVGLQGTVFAFLGAEGAIHLSEEVKGASRILPWSLLASLAINGTLGFAMLVAVLFTLGPVNAALNTPTGYPYIEAFRYATGSVAGATGLASIIIALGICACTSILSSSSRQLWAFSRDNAVPGAHLFKRIHRSKLPVVAICFTLVLAVLLALINIGSAVALNAIISVTVAASLGSYIPPLALVLYRRVQHLRGKGRDLPWGPFRLGRYSGVAINLGALLWCILTVFWSFWPATTPTTAAKMNWSCVIYGAVTIFAMGFWFVDGHNRFKGPVRDVDGGIEPVKGWTEVEKGQVST